MVSYKKIILLLVLAFVPFYAYTEETALTAVTTEPQSATVTATAGVDFPAAVSKAVNSSAGVKKALASLKLAEALLEKEKGANDLLVSAGVWYSESAAESLALQYPESEKKLVYRAGLSNRLITGGELSLNFSSSRAALMFPAYGGPIDASLFRPSINPYYYPEAALIYTQPLLKGLWGLPELKKMQALEYRVKAARDGLKTGILNAVHAVKEAYYKVYYRDIALKAGRIYLRDVESVYSSMKAAGSGEAVLLQAKAAVISAAAAIKVLEKDYNAAQEAFMDTAGFLPDEWGQAVAVPDETIEGYYAPAEMSKDLLDTLVSSQPGVALEKNLLLAAETEKDAAQNAALPELNLSGSLGINGLSGDLGGAFEEMGSAKYGDFMIGAWFSWSFPGREASGAGAEKTEQANLAKASLGAASNACRINIRAAYSGITAEKENYGAMKEARLMLEKRAALLKQAGAWGELLRAHLDRFEARKREAEAFVSYAEAVADWNLVNGKYDLYYNEYVKANSAPIAK